MPYKCGCKLREEKEVFPFLRVYLNLPWKCESCEQRSVERIGEHLRQADAKVRDGAQTPMEVNALCNYLNDLHKMRKRHLDALTREINMTLDAIANYQR